MGNGEGVEMLCFGDHARVEDVEVGCWDRVRENEYAITMECFEGCLKVAGSEGFG